MRARPVAEPDDEIPLEAALIAVRRVADSIEAMEGELDWRARDGADGESYFEDPAIDAEEGDRPASV